MHQRIVLVMVVLLLGCFTMSFAQNRGNPPFNTANTHDDPSPKAKSYKPDDKNLVYIIKKDTRKYLSDNKCFENITRQMGFEYIAVPKGQPYYASEFERLLHNLGSKFIILIKNGIFWKIKVKKAYKKCKYGYGDFVG